MSANLAVLEGDHAVCPAHEPADRQVRMFFHVGARAPVQSTAVGKVLLAALGRDATTAVLRRTGMPARTGIARSPAWATLLGELDNVLRLDDDEEAGVACVAVPLKVGFRTSRVLRCRGHSRDLTTRRPSASCLPCGRS